MPANLLKNSRNFSVDIFYASINGRWLLGINSFLKRINARSEKYKRKQRRKEKLLGIVNEARKHTENIIEKVRAIKVNLRF